MYGYSLSPSIDVDITILALAMLDYRRFSDWLRHNSVSILNLISVLFIYDYIFIILFRKT